MEEVKAKIMKVVSREGYRGGNYYARSFQEFPLQNLRGDLNPFVEFFGDDKFTDVYIRTESGDIYRIFQKEILFSTSHNWIAVNASNPEFIYTFKDIEMYLDKIKVGQNFICGNHHSTPVVEIVCVNMNKVRMNISNFKEAEIVKNFEELSKGESYV